MSLGWGLMEAWPAALCIGPEEQEGRFRLKKTWTAKQGSLYFYRFWRVHQTGQKQGSTNMASDRTNGRPKRVGLFLSREPKLCNIKHLVAKAVQPTDRTLRVSNVVFTFGT